MKYKNEAEQAFVDAAKDSGLDITKKGYPDFIVFRGRYIVGFVEVKKKGTKPRNSQLRFQYLCYKQRIPYYVWYPGDPFPFNVAEFSSYPDTTKSVGKIPKK